MPDSAEYYVAVVGGAVAGSVAAEVLAAHGIRVAVFEQNRRPYGKIEDGLPRWHVAQRKQEYTHIDDRLKKPLVDYVPCARLGRDFTFEELTGEWGFSAVILANGAWRDRPLGVPEAEAYTGNGFVYQNPYLYWYNHKHEATYEGERHEAPDGALVVGGGLASIDVVKILQFENYERALRERGLETSLHEMEAKGIPAACRRLGVEPAELGVKGPLLLYRRREQDMPLASIHETSPSPEQVARAENVRRKVLHHAQEKYLFHFQERRVTTGVVVENGRMAGLKVMETRVEGRKAEPIPGTEQELRAPLVISSIGSVPELIPGIAVKGEYYTFGDEHFPQYLGNERVFGVGNVVTGQGNIHVSLVHSREVTNRLLESYFGQGGAAARGAQQALAVEAQVRRQPPLRAEAMAALASRVRGLQDRAGYPGSYEAWMAEEVPA